MTVPTTPRRAGSRRWSKGRRAAATATLVVGGGAFSVGAWVGGERYLALGLAAFYLVCGAVAYRWAGGGGDVAALLRASGDERQRQLDVRATAVAAYATMVFCIGAAAVDLARGGTGGPWAMVLGVGGLSYAAALVVLRWR
jgi:hypothetical protein